MPINKRLKQFILWRPIILLIPGILILLAIFAGKITQREQHDVLDEFLERRALTTQNQILTPFSSLIGAVNRIAARWQTNDKNYEKLWRSDARSYLRDVTSVESISYIDGNLDEIWTVSRSALPAQVGEPLSADLQEKLEAARSTGRTELTPALELEDGTYAIKIYSPIVHNGEFNGFIVARINIQTLIDTILDIKSGIGFNLIIRNNESLIYTNAGPPPAEARTQEFSIDMDADDGSWEFEIFATPGTLDKILGPVPVLISLTGIFFALLSLAILSSLQRFYIQADLLRKQVQETQVAQQNLQHMATHDELTDLPNRHGLKDFIGRQIKLAGQRNLQFHVLFIDLDHFKDVNDTLGHEFGDSILQQIAERLRTSLGAEHFIARMGGDEFIICTDVGIQVSNIDALMTQILQSIHRAYVSDGNEIHLSASIGSATYPADGTTISELISHSDAALYQAKNAGRNTYLQYERRMGIDAEGRLALLGKLRSALRLGEFEMWFQPRVDLTTQKIVGAEALLRWRKSDGTIVTPKEFLQVTEDTGIVVPIGISTIRMAMQSFLPLLDKCPTLSLSINLSSRQLAHPNILDDMKALFEQTGFPPERLEVELTEQVLIKNVVHNRNVLNVLTSLGVSIALDDFGTGYSSLAYLKTFPIRVLKVDRSFIAGLPGNKDDEIIVRTILQMAKNLGLVAVAEGVETVAQTDWLAAKDCNQVQGFYYSKPLTQADLIPAVERLNGIRF